MLPTIGGASAGVAGLGDRPAPDEPPRSEIDVESTASLLALVRDGDRQAADRLVRRFRPALYRFATRRLPRRARDSQDTDDLVQITLVRALEKVNEFEPRRPGAFMAYLRRSLMNAIVDQIRRSNRTPDMQELPDDVKDRNPSQLEVAIGRERVEAFEKARLELSEQHQLAIFLRIELGLPHREVADVLNCSSPDAARMVVSRAVTRLTEVLHASR
jgi:RNA polymerase sigma-70 factor (ECF subfamily)